MVSFFVFPEAESYSDSMSGNTCLFMTSRGMSEIKICSKNTRMIIFQVILLGSTSVLFAFHNKYRLTLTIKTEMKINFN